VVYDARAGAVSLDVPAGVELVAVTIGSDSSSPLFTECTIAGNIDPCDQTAFFHASIGRPFGSMRFGRIMRPGLREDFLLDDLSVVAALADPVGDGQLRTADLVYIPVPEPSAGLLACGGLFVSIWMFVGCPLARFGRASRILCLAGEQRAPLRASCEPLMATRVVAGKLDWLASWTGEVGAEETKKNPPGTGARRVDRHLGDSLIW
jgi:hypothetical protein